MSDFDYISIENAYQRIHQNIIKTPLITNDYINKKLDANVYFKLENLQKTGSFKIRGATHKISKLTSKQKSNGIVAYSSGNHAQAVAFASLQENINAKIIMPNNAPKIKLHLTKSWSTFILYINKIIY